jgi:hypothetical protein
MRLPRRTVIPRLEHALSNFLKGSSLKDWVEDTVVRLLKSVGQDGPPVKLSRELRQARRITNVKYELGAHPVWGRLTIGDDGFVVILSPTCKSQGSFWHQFALAHEIAHTFFYDIRNWPPVHLIYLEPGNRDLEWLCGYFAKCLFAPASWLRNQMKCYPQLGSEGFSLTVLDQLEKTFAVPWQIVAERIVEDLQLWNCIILQFTKCSETGKFSCERTKSVWRLNWQTIPSEGTENLFVPVGRRMKDGTMKFPRAKGVITMLIEECIQNGKNSRTYKRKIPSQILNSQTTGNLGKFLSGLLGSHEVTVYIHCRMLSQEQIFDWGQTGQQSITMCFPLNQP